MIGEAHLIKIMRAADRDDPDDVALRELMVSALRECYVDFTELLHRGPRWIGTLPASAAASFTAGFPERRHKSGQRAIQTIH
jgi:hypothetical protein